MERILAILVEMWVSDDWRQSRTFILVFGAIIAVALLISAVGWGIVM